MQHTWVQPLTVAGRWDGVDLDRGHLQVRAALQRLNGTLVHTEMPKTTSSRRALAPADVVVESLRSHRAAQSLRPVRMGSTA